ncbi:YgfZ/GcvT domain-containing protein [Granulicella sibirica]|uniref:Folate-dependent protein for Fe/S cluster synthesis/repair in oxidative stress n=1 Tax=Granulicella sibirica TaxID=2479048 RepID=A0A4Q0T3K2_9BACT|nr:folate-binding protein YgfZ [Granulicella sibirica]RXH57502.1 Folate-dependent protein for Fe/S cluster synthesis/repair in oxidative stress [Granulicella sibirica]
MTASAQIEDVAGLRAGESAVQLQWLLETVGVSELDGLGWIRATGEDRTRWLNGMVTNSIQELKPGEGNYSFALNAQGRIQGDLWAFVDADSIWMETAKDRVAAMMELFDRYIIMDDVELVDVSVKRVGLGVVGPLGGELLAKVGIAAGKPARRASVDWDGASVEVISFEAGRFEVWTDEATAERLREGLIAEAAGLGGGAVGAEAVDWLRILDGTPAYGVDIRDKELPQETGQTRALHFAKGCYLGQEIVERIRSRGNVHRGFGAFVLTGDVPAVGAVLEADGKAVGELTSVAAIPLAGATVQLGLGYVRREAVERGAEISYSKDSVSGKAVPVAVPYRG